MNWRWALWGLFNPSQLIIAAVLLACILLAFRRMQAGRLVAMIAGTALFLFGVLPTSSYMTHYLEARFPRPNLPARVDGIVLMAGSERPEATAAFGEPQVKYNGGRYLTALRLAEQYPMARVVYTGGARNDPKRGVVGGSMSVARRILEGSGIAPERLLYETGSGNTCDSPARTKRFVNAGPAEVWVVVTSAIHVPRTVACFRAAGWAVIPYPADYQAIAGGLNLGSFDVAGNLGLLDLASHEWVGLAYYRLTGRTSEFLPGPVVDRVATGP